MPIDASIYQMQTPDIMGNLQQGMKMRDMMDEQKLKQKKMDEDKILQDAYKWNTTTDANGNAKVNRSAFTNELQQRGLGHLAYQEGSKIQAQDAQNFKNQLEAERDRHEYIANTLTPVKDQGTYTAAVENLTKNGFLKPGEAPPAYDADSKDLVDMHLGLSMNAKDRIGKQLDQQKFDYEQKKDDRTYQQRDRELGLKHEEVGLKRDELGLAKEDKAAKELDRHLSQGWSGRSGQAGSVQGKINAAEAAEQLIEQGKFQKNGLDSRQIEELAQSTGRLLGGGAAASARVEALVPHTMWGRAQSLKEWLTNNPTGAGQEEFVKRMAETVAREKELATNQMRQFQIEGLPAHQALKKRNPELYESILRSKGIDPSMIDEKGRYKGGSSKSGDGGAPKTFKTNEIEWAD